MKSKSMLIGDMFSLAKGRKAPTAYDSPSGESKRYIQINDLRNDENIRYADDPNGVEVFPSDICIVWDGANAGTVGYGLSGYIGSTITRLRPISKDIIYTPYIGRFLQTKFQMLNTQTTGSTIPHVDKVRLLNIKITQPELEEQKRIASILDKADSIRWKRQEAISLAGGFLSSVFFDMFGDPVTNPKQWPVHRLGEFLTFVTSGSRGWAKYYVPSGARFIRSFDVQMNSISDTDAVYVNPPDSAETRRTQVKPRDVLLTITGSKIGRVAPVEPSIGKAYVSQHVAILRLDSSIHPYYLSMFLSDARGGQHQIRRMQYGQTKPGLNLEQIRSFELPCPPLAMQDRFVALWTRFKKHGENHATAEKHTNDLFNSLVQRAFRGEL